MSKRDGFTLIELMIVVGIIGVLATIAIPSFQGYVDRSKASEVSGMVGAMHTGAVAYYNTEWVTQGLSGSTSIHCIIDSSSDDDGFGPPAPTEASQIGGKRFYDFSADADYSLLGITNAGTYYHSYFLDSSEKDSDQCGDDIGSGPASFFDAAGWNYSFRAIYYRNVAQTSGLVYVLNSVVINDELAKGPGIIRLVVAP